MPISLICALNVHSTRKKYDKRDLLKTHRFANSLDSEGGFRGTYPQYPRTEKAIKNRETMRTLIWGSVP